MSETLSCFPMDSKVSEWSEGLPVYDRPYSAADLREFFKAYFTDGVFVESAVDPLKVEAYDGFYVKVRPGKVNVGSTLAHIADGEVKTVNLGAGPEAGKRTDTVVARLDLTKRIVELDAKAGEVSDTYPRPELTRNDTIWELGLADVRRTAGEAEVSSAAITDTRLETERCGVATPFMKIDTDTIQADMLEVVKQGRYWVERDVEELNQATSDAVSAMNDALSSTVLGTVARLWSESDAQWFDPGSDLDNFKEPGTWIASKSNGLPYNRPETWYEAFVMWVFSTEKDKTEPTQVILNMETGDARLRRLKNEAWGEWLGFGADEEFQARGSRLAPGFHGNDVRDLPSDKRDMNLFTDPGVWFAETADSAPYLSNRPEGLNVPYRFEIVGAKKYNYEFCTQIVTTIEQNARFFVRGAASSGSGSTRTWTWSEWRELGADGVDEELRAAATVTQPVLESQTAAEAFDFNDKADPGCTFALETAVFENCTNSPVDEDDPQPFRLEVLEKDTMVVQTVVTFGQNPHVYVRGRTAASWGAWRDLTEGGKLEGKAVLAAPVDSSSNYLASGADLNEIVDPGTWFTSSKTETAKLVNAPEGLANPVRLVVAGNGMYLASSTGGSKRTGCTQRLQLLDGDASEYVRSGALDSSTWEYSWTDWDKVVTENSMAGLGNDARWTASPQDGQVLGEGADLNELAAAGNKTYYVKTAATAATIAHKPATCGSPFTLRSTYDGDSGWSQEIVEFNSYGRPRKYLRVFKFSDNVWGAWQRLSSVPDGSDFTSDHQVSSAYVKTGFYVSPHSFPGGIIVGYNTAGDDVSVNTDEIMFTLTFNYDIDATTEKYLLRGVHPQAMGGAWVYYHRNYIEIKSENTVTYSKWNSGMCIVPVTWLN